MFAWARAASSVVEHLTFNQGVPGSIPGRPTIFNFQLPTSNSQPPTTNSQRSGRRTDSRIPDRRYVRDAGRELRAVGVGGTRCADAAVLGERQPAPARGLCRVDAPASLLADSHTAGDSRHIRSRARPSVDDLPRVSANRGERERYRSRCFCHQPSCLRRRDTADDRSHTSAVGHGALPGSVDGVSVARRRRHPPRVVRLRSAR